MDADMRVERTETKIVAREILRLTASLLVAGQICKPGTLVEFDDVDARMLLARNVAVPASKAEVEKGNVLSAPRSNVTAVDL
jgi:hypothetical protein